MIFAILREHIVGDGQGYPNDEEREAAANAIVNLIAAAPDLAALNIFATMVQVHEILTESVGGEEEVIKLLESAIAQASGTKP